LEYISVTFQKGGPFMFIILGVLVFAFAIIVERFSYIGVKNRIDTSKFVDKVLQLLNQGGIANAVELCNLSKAALPVITKAGLQKYGKSPKEVQNAFELAAMNEIPKLEKRTHYLAMIANVATLLGLLGTIIGLIQSFERSISPPEGAQRDGKIRSRRTTHRRRVRSKDLAESRSICRRDRR